MVCGSRALFEQDGRRLVFYGQVALPGLGSPWFLVDNGGAGFTPGDAAVDFAWEATRTRCGEVRSALDELRADGEARPMR
jgi:hypothetical protein